MKDEFKDRWVERDMVVWKQPRVRKPTRCVILTNGYKKLGTAVFESTAKGEVEVVLEGVQFHIDHAKKTVTVVGRGTSKARQWKLWPPLTRAQKKFWGADFGMQYSS